MEVILMRHSTALGNPKRRFIGITDVPLLPEGIALARQRASLAPAVEHVYVSPLQRARSTAALLWPGIPTTVVPGLREADFGILENRSHEELQQENNAAYLSWLGQESWEGYPGGESFAAMEVRVKAAFEACIRDGIEKGCEHIGLMTHGGVVMLILEKYCGFRPQFAENCTGYRIMAVHEENGVACTAYAPLW